MLSRVLIVYVEKYVTLHCYRDVVNLLKSVGNNADWFTRCFSYSDRPTE